MRRPPRAGSSPKMLELSIKSTGSINQRKVQKILPVCSNDNQQESFLLHTENNKLYALQWKDNQLEEITSKPLENIDKIIGVIEKAGIPEVTTGSPLIILKTAEGIEFYELNLSNGEFKLLDTDDQFSEDRDWDKNATFHIGKVQLDGIITIVVKRDNDYVKVFRLDRKIGDGNPFKRLLFTTVDELYRADQVWVTKPVCPSTNNDFQPDWIFTRKDDKIYSFKFVNEKEVAQVSSLKLPNDLKDSVVNVQLNSLPRKDATTNNCQDLIVFFKEQLALIYSFDETTKEYQQRDLFYGDNSTLSSSCGNKKSFSITGGPTLRHFQEDASLSEIPVRYSGELLKSPFVFEKEDSSSVWLIGNSDDTSVDNKLIWYETQLKEYKENPYVKPNKTLEEGKILDEITMDKVYKLKLDLDSRSTHSILDGISSRVFTEAVNVQTGGIGFNLKLLPEIGFGIQYSTQGVGMDGPPTLGKDGWSTISPNYIAIDRKSDVLDIEAIYYLVLDSVVYNLEQQETSTSVKKVFKISNTKLTEDEINSISVIYEENKNSWTVDTRTSRMVFGFDKNAIKWGWQLRSWKETEAEAMVKIPSEWYLTEMRKKSLDASASEPEMILSYDYFQVVKYTENEIESKRKEYTEAVQLLKVTSQDSKEVNISFDYDKNRRLTSYSAEVRLYKQKVGFLYDASERLQTIRQEMDGKWEEMMQFYYDGSSGRVSSVNVPPRNLNVVFETKVLSLSGPDEGALIPIEDAPGNKAFSVGHGISISVFGTSNRLVAVSAADGTTWELGKIDPNTENLYAQRIVVNKNCVIRHMEVSSENRVMVYCFDPAADPQWTLPQVKRLSKKSSVKIGSEGTIITLDESGLIEVFEWDFEKSDFKFIHKYKLSSGKKPEFFEATDNIIAWYNEGLFSWIVKTLKSWTCTQFEKQIQPKNDCFQMFKTKFDMGPKTEEMVDPLFSSIKFQLRENAMALMTCSVDDWILNTHVDLLVLDQSGNPAFYSHFKVEQDDVSKLNTTQEVEENDNKYFFKYVKEDDRFLIQVSDGDDKHTEELTKSFREDQAKNEQRMILFDFAKYFSSFTSKSIYQVGNTTQIHHDGVKWEVNTKYDANGPNTIDLGKDFKLKKSDKESKVELIKAGSNQVVRSFTENANTVYPYYPGYIASIDEKVDKNRTEILFFYRDSNGKEITTTDSLKDEVVHSGFSTSQFLVTSFPKRETRFNVRISGWMNTQNVFAVVGSTLIKCSHIERTIAYDYHKPKLTQARQFNFGEASIIGGGDKSKYGSILYSFEMKPTYPKAFDGNGTFIEDMKPDDDKKKPEPPKTPPLTTLFDKLHLKPIADLSPFEPKDCQVGYFGFEDYENANKGLECEYDFSQSAIIKSGLSLTGNNFLRLEKAGDSLSFSIPLKKDQSYSISAWVRCLNKSPEIIASLLKISIPGAEGVNWVSKLLLTKGDWSFLQLKLYAHELKPFWENFLNKTPLADGEIIQVEIERTASSGQVDIDHILFSPVTWNGEIFVYSGEQVQQNILGNTGLIVHNVYDGDGNVVVKTNGLGQVTRMQFETTDTNKEINLMSLVQLESFVDPGWIQSFQHDPLVTFTSDDLSGFKAFRTGLEYSDSSNESSFRLNIEEFHSFALRFSYAFSSTDSIIKLEAFGRQFTLKSDGNRNTKLSITSCGDFKLEKSGYLVFGFFGESRTLVWSSQSLLCDKSLPTSLNKEDKIKPMIFLKGNVFLENMIILPNPNMKITYTNTIGEEIQVVSFVNEHNVKVYENYYDAMGRFQARTKDTLIPLKNSNEESLMSFRPDFVKSLDVEKQKLEGEASDLNPEDKGTPFTSVIYENGPLEDWSSEGRPGAKYSLSGSFGTKYTKDPHIRLIRVFPPEKGYKFKVKTNRGGYSEVMIMNSKDIVVAHAAMTPGAKHILATYDYDDKGRLICSLPPEYHERAGTLDKNQPWSPIISTKDDNSIFGTFYEYDEEDRLIFKSDPDAGTFEYIFHNDTGNPTHALHKRTKVDTEYDSVVYFEYGENDGALLTEVGELSDLKGFSKESLLLNSTAAFPRASLKKIEQLGSRHGPLIQSQRVITQNKGNFDYIQELDYQLPHGNLIADTQILPSDEGQPAALISTGFIRSLDGEKILQINYAAEDQVSLSYAYNLQGQISQVYLTRENLEPVTIARYEYASNGQCSKEVLLEYNSGGNKQLLQPLESKIDFNSPGYAVKYSNPFFTQEINYDDDGFGDLASGEPGYPSATSFQNTWADKSALIRPETLIAEGLSKSTAEICHEALRSLGYLDDYSKILKLFRPELDMETLPVLCSESTARKISTAFSKIFMERKNYSYKFQYGNHKELIKVKFFDSDKEKESRCSGPLTSEGLSSALGINTIEAQKLWDELRENRFIVEDKEKGQSHTIQGKEFSSIINSALTDDFKELDRNLRQFQTVVAHSLGKRAKNAFSLNDFSKIFDNWKIGIEGVKEGAHQIYKFLEGKGYLSNEIVQPKIFQETFTNSVGSLGLDLGKVFKELSGFFACQIGKNAFDFEVYDMDYNGNPKLFYNGFERLEFTYKKNTNQIETLSSLSGIDQEYTHDPYGNLNSIKNRKDGTYLLKIHYDILSSRPLKMELKDGRKLFFRYDYKGERVSKQVYDSNGKLQQEIRYLGRDEKSRVLVDQEITYIAENIPPRVVKTTYFYGPRGLFGFRRNGKFFNVLLDNIGSTRFVLRNGQVVASYNYLPYGQLASSFIGLDPDGDIRYRFTGQEFDNETGLYNFHFRIYDPLIGRFYQVDPNEIFYSPYKYVGNAPIIFIDPDGREPFTIIAIITLAIIGAYLGGAAANNSWNPAKWNWKDPMTYVGIVLGAIAGGTLIPGAGASFAALGAVIASTSVKVAIIVSIGTATAYLSVASGMESWDPTKWDWKSPQLFNAAFQGFATGAGLIGGFHGMKQTFVGLTKNGFKIAYVSGAAVLGVSFGYYESSSRNGMEFRFWKWDFTKPGTFNGILVSGPSGATKIESGFKVVKVGKSFLKEIKSGFPTLKTTIFKLLNKHGEFDLLEIEFTSKIPTNQGKMVVANKFVQYAFDDPSTVSSISIFKDDFSQIAKSVSISSEKVLKGIIGDLGVAGTYTKIDWTDSPVSPIPTAKLDFWLEHLAKNAYTRLANNSTLLSNKTMGADALLINNGSVFAFIGRSGFLANGPVLLLEREYFPEIFEALFDPPMDIDLQDVDFDIAENKANIEPNKKIFSEPDTKKLLSKSEISNGVEESVPWRTCSLETEMRNLIGSSCMSLATIKEKRTVLTEPGWEKQSDPTLTYASFNYNDPGRIYSNVSENPTVSLRRAKREVEHSTFKWESEDTAQTLPTATSSGSRPTGFINRGIKFISKLWNLSFSNNKPNPTEHEQQKNSENYENFNKKFGKFDGKQWEQEGETSEWEKCVPWVFSDDVYIDGFTCYTNKGIIQVTPKSLEEFSPEALMTTDSQDTYEDCQFMRNRGMGTAYCKGHKSNVKYITYFDERPFDRVNDNLLLFGLLLHFYQVWKSDEESHEINKELIPVEKEKLLSWKEELESLQLALKMLRGVSKDKFYMDWAWNIFEDRLEEFQMLEKYGSASAEELEQFEDNLCALKEEIYEGYLISHKCTN